MARGRSRRQARSLAQLKRRQGRRPPRQCILIVCEGETEAIYFKSLRDELRLTLTEVEVKGIGGVHITVVNHALARRQKREVEVKKAKRKGYQSTPEFDEVWCVFDVEGVTINRQPFYQAVDKAQANKLNLAVSNPAFEYWYLLHFKDTARPFANADEVINVLKAHLPNYEKAVSIFHILFDYTDTAIVRAKRVLSNHPDQEDSFPNPSTEVFKLVEALKAYENRTN